MKNLFRFFLFFKTYTRIGDSMSKKEEFKEFVKNNTYLINYVKNNEMTWQKFYEMYDIYGEESDVWKDYQKKEKKNDNIVNWLRGLDLNTLEEGVNSLQRVVGVLGDLSTKNTKEEYVPRPLYKHFDD